MKSRDEVTARLREVILEVAQGPRRGELSGSSRLIEDIGLDSLDYATVLLTCEEWLGVRVVEDHVDWQRIGTVDGLASFLFEQQPAEPEAPTAAAAGTAAETAGASAGAAK